MKELSAEDLIAFRDRALRHLEMRTIYWRTALAVKEAHTQERLRGQAVQHLDKLVGDLTPFGEMKLKGGTEGA